MNPKPCPFCGKQMCKALDDEGDFYAHEASIDKLDHHKPLSPTPESGEAVFKVTRDEVERAA